MAEVQRRDSKSSAASSWVREQILSGDLKAGSVVRPEDVGHRLGISQTPAREALQTLKAEGFLALEPGVGFVVQELSGEDVADIFLVHSFLAGELASRAIANAQPEDVDELEATHFDLLAAMRRKQWDEVERCNHSFHRQITLLARSPKLAQVIGLVSRYVPRSFYQHVEGWVAASAHDHSAVIEAFRAQDADAARSAMAAHITNAGDLLAAHIPLKSGSTE